jgi:O-antigen ligase
LTSLVSRCAIGRALFQCRLLPDANVRQIALGAAFAILVSYNAVLALGFGLFGSSGNSIATGSLLLILAITLFLLSFRKGIHFQQADLAFMGLLIAVLISSSINAGVSKGSSKEYLLLVSTFAVYAACRPMASIDISVTRSSFERVTAVIVVLGAAFTAAEIIERWDDLTGKPLVFGFDAAGTYFMGALGFLTIALVTIDKPNTRRTALVSAIIFLPAAIFAAAMVRFTFIALAGSLLIAMILTDAGKRWHVAAVAFTIFLAVVVGLSARYSLAKVYAGYVFETNIQTGDASAMPSCNLAVNMRNSIAIREALARDALRLIPAAGLVGTGLDSFMQFSCIKAHEVHNSVLQMAVEFGWLGGALFLLLVGLAIYHLVPMAKRNGAIRFVLCGLVFALLLSLAHGRISRDSALFALLGCCVGLRETANSHDSE